MQANNKETRRLQNNIRHIEKREEKQFEYKAIRFVTLLEMGHQNPDIYRGTGGLFVIREYIRYAQCETIMLIFKDNKAKLDILIDLLTYGYLDEENFWKKQGGDIMAILTLVLGLFKASFVYNDTMFITGFTSPTRIEVDMQEKDFVHIGNLTIVPHVSDVETCTLETDTDLYIIK